MFLKILKRIGALGILPVMVSTLAAQTTALALDQAIQRALRNNREIHIARMEIEKGRAAVAEAFGYALPSLDVSADFSRFISKPKMAFPDFGAMLNNATYGVLFHEKLIPFDQSKFLPLKTKLQTFAQTNNYKTQVQITQILFNSAVFRGIGASQIYLNLSKEKLKSAISKTALNVKKAFYGVLLSQEMLKIANERLANAKDHLKNIKAMQEQGLVSDFDAMRAEVQVENIRPLIVQLENADKAAANGLKILLGIDQSAKLVVQGKMEYNAQALPDEKSLIEQAVASNLDVQTLKIKQQLDDERVAIDRGQYWPTLAAFGNYTYAGSGDNWDFQNYNSIMVGLSFSMNLFQGGRTRHKVRQDQITSGQTRAQIQNLTDIIVSGVKAKLNDLKRVQTQITAMQKNIDLAERAYKIAEDRYKQGTGNELEVKDADTALSQAKMNYSNAVHDYVVARAELDDLVGRVDPRYYEPFEEVLKK